MTDWNLPPREIERRSFALIEAEAPKHDLAPEAWSIVRRMIHTSADFDFLKNVRFHPAAIAEGKTALGRGAEIFCDTNMAKSGISRARLAPFGCAVHCLVADPQVAQRARALGITRSAAAVDAALPRLKGAIYVIGNAPTALFRLLELIQAGDARPALVIGLPVGFVNAAEAKQALLSCPLPYITSLGRKGGSNLAASVVNALAELARPGQE